MTVDSKYYTHDSDRLALQALQSIPGFTKLLKAYMKAATEKRLRIQNMSSNLRINEKQMSKYYEMLPPICEKLGIEIPELYLTLDVNPNSYTYGDTKPFIVITSGLLEALPDELIPTVLAHECGHIACQHCLYTTMGAMILNGTASLLSLWEISDLVTVPLQVAFYYWMRCSEYSADRAAALYEGSADKIVDLCMYMTGYNKNLGGGANKEVFMEQALEYKEFIDDSKWNKTLEFIMFSGTDHPLNAVRAYECNKWTQEERFTKMVEYLNIPKYESTIPVSAYLKEVPMIESSKFYIGQNYLEISEKFKEFGFDNIKTVKISEKGRSTRDGQTLNILINNKSGFSIGDWYDIDSEITVEYYEPATEEEIAAAHPGQLRTPNSSKYYQSRHYQEVANEFEKAGFAKIELEEQLKDKRPWLSRDGGVLRISVNGQTQFEKGEWFDENATIRITYQIFVSVK